ncbi:uncharacterized protein [Pyxicephalus adspersus]|uniref:uncharacterized protein n=1 Tax=Pyxicephalus adspersus TaxID=30357 RepID=UPI003B5BA60C
MKIYVILILSGLVTAGLATLCKSCWNIGTTKCCETSSIFCKESQCMTISEYCTINKKFYYTVKKTCAVPIMCGNCISVSTDNNFLLRLSGVCAKGDDSNSQLNFTKTCPDPLPPNGFMCPSCYVNGTTDGCNDGGLATTCESCWSLGTTKCCKTSPIYCKESQCMTVSEYCSVNKKTYYTVKKTCAAPEICDNCFSASTDNGFFLRVSAVCAEGDFSNSDLDFSKTCPDPLPPNDFMCPTCYVNGTTDGCDNEGKMVKCGGNEKECVVYRGDVTLAGDLGAPK